MNCVVCEREFLGQHPPATRFEGHPGWGSRFDDSTSGDQCMQIYVCDDCLFAKRACVDLRKTAVRKTIVIEEWACPRCGGWKVRGVCQHCKEEA